jgi:hypothetical protein
MSDQQPTALAVNRRVGLFFYTGPTGASPPRLRTQLVLVLSGTRFHMLIVNQAVIASCWLSQRCERTWPAPSRRLDSTGAPFLRFSPAASRSSSSRGSQGSPRPKATTDDSRPRGRGVRVASPAGRWGRPSRKTTSGLRAPGRARSGADTHLLLPLMLSARRPLPAAADAARPSGPRR